MNYSRPPFPKELFEEFNTTAKSLGYTKRGEKWRLLKKLLAYALLHPNLFEYE